MAELVLELAQTVSSVGVKTSYGERIDIDGTTVIPVALGSYGFGGGGGTTDADAGTANSGTGSRELHGQGSGGGGGGISIPLGAYVGKQGQVRFEPNLIGLILVATPFVWVTGKALKAIIRALKH